MQLAGAKLVKNSWIFPRANVINLKGVFPNTVFLVESCVAGAKTVALRKPGLCAIFMLITDNKGLLVAVP